jgi:hypothetical protein
MVSGLSKRIILYFQNVYFSDWYSVQNAQLPKHILSIVTTKCYVNEIDLGKDPNPSVAIY